MEDKPLKIVQTPARYYPYVGGVEKYVFDLSNQLTKKNNEVIVICANEPKAENSEGAVKVKRLPYIMKIANTNITPTLFFKLLKTPFDVIHTHIPTPWSADMSMFASLLKGKPLVVTYHNDIINKEKSRILAFLYNHTFLKILLRRAAAIIVTQEKYIESSSYLSNYKNKIFVIPNGVDTSNINDLGLMKDTNTIFFLSSLDRYHRYKGLDTLLQAIVHVKKKNPKIQLVVGGSGELTSEYKKLARKLDIESNIIFIGNIDEMKKNDYYQRSSVFILPSNSREEGFGIVLLEAMANKVPVITTKYAGVADDVEQSKAGYIVIENSPEELAEKINLLVSNPLLAKEMGRNGHILVNEKYSWEKIADQVYELYLKML